MKKTLLIDLFWIVLISCNTQLGPGFLLTGIGNSLSQWGNDLMAGGHRSGQAFIGGWQFSADLSLGAGLRTTKSFDLLSLKNGFGPFGEQGLKLGTYRLDMLYRNPSSGLGHGTLFSLKQVKNGGNLLRWDYGNLHSGGTGWHSTFRFNIRNVQYGSSAQRSWAAPFKFWNYKVKKP